MDEPSTTNLLFHVVARDDGDPLAATPGSITVDRLRDVIGWQRGAGRSPARLGEYGSGVSPGTDRFTVSFDDAHPSVKENAAPVLKALDVPATMFASTAHSGRTEHCLGPADLAEVAADPLWDVGSHAHRHERLGWRLYDEDEAAWRSRLGESAATSKQTLEGWIGVDVDLFAYPFGQAPGGARDAVRAAGYRGAVTVDGSSAWDGDPMGIPRLDGVPAPTGIDETPGISVVVPACDRVDVLREVVRRLAAQSYPEEAHEVLVVDDGSEQDLSAALAPWLGDRVRLVALPGADGIFRAGQARQLGAELARHPVLAFLDADVAVDQDFLWHLAWVHARDPRAVLLGYLSGYNLQDLGHRHEVGAVVGEGRLTGDRVNVIPDRSREPTLAACMDNIALLDDPWGLAYTGNLSVSKELLGEVGGFATSFDGWGFEDVDLGVRLHQAGGRFVFSRFALSYHLADPGPGSLSNPFRDPRPERATFDGVLRNLATLESRHRGHAGIEAFCGSVRADVDEICSRPYTVGVCVDGAGGFSLQRILDRVAYAERIGAKELYVLGPRVAERGDLDVVARAAAEAGLAVALEIPTAEATTEVLAGLKALGIDPRRV